MIPLRLLKLFKRPEPVFKNVAYYKHGPMDDDVAEKAKEYNPRIKVVVGGVHGSAVPEHVLLDYVVVGEGDFAFPDSKIHCTQRLYNPRLIIYAFKQNYRG